MTSVRETTARSNRYDGNPDRLEDGKGVFAKSSVGRCGWYVSGWMFRYLIMLVVRRVAKTDVCANHTRPGPYVVGLHRSVYCRLWLSVISKAVGEKCGIPKTFRVDVGRCYVRRCVCHNVDFSCRRQSIIRHAIEQRRVRRFVLLGRKYTLFRRERKNVYIRESPVGRCT